MAGVYPLRIDDEFREAIAKVAAFAAKPENHYVPDESKAIPGEIEQHCLEWDDYRVVYSVTTISPLTCRHLSVSLMRGGYPHPFAVWTIAHELGFTGATAYAGVVHEPSSSWSFEINKTDRCIVVVEPLSEPN